MPFKQMSPSHGPWQGLELGTQESRAPVWTKDFLSLRRASFSDKERERGKKERKRKKKIRR